ncbi:hypothetical protein CDCA_CDCA03G0835 [Cyanidium caldarium]|uniref:Uncharacterized protein n=1 Tax=Cyanidium caldarium TaxID=2771 RepID=A0AAV9IRT6_CYACA|nr:hypothetical protein CDCA_CDCA03G0835 [Cyanidium caldarium]
MQLAFIPSPLLSHPSALAAPKARPSCSLPPSSTFRMTAAETSPDRRAFLLAGLASAVLAALPRSALADGAVSPATRQRARGVYGPRVLAYSGLIDQLSETAASGNLQRVAAMTADPSKLSKRERAALELEEGFGAFYEDKRAFSLLRNAVRGERTKEVEMDRVVDRFFTAVNDIHTAAEKGDADKVQRLAKDLSLYLRGVQTVADLTPSGLENVPGVASMSDYDWKRWRKIPEIASKKLAPGSQ